MTLTRGRLKPLSGWYLLRAIRWLDLHNHGLKYREIAELEMTAERTVSRAIQAIKRDIAAKLPLKPIDNQ